MAVALPERSRVTARFEDGSETRRAIMPDAPDPEYTGAIDSGPLPPRRAGARARLYYLRVAAQANG